jgi:hypothetical protein
MLAPYQFAFVSLPCVSLTSVVNIFCYTINYYQDDEV